MKKLNEKRVKLEFQVFCWGEGISVGVMGKMFRIGK